jgi:hypothetical protein
VVASACVPLVSTVLFAVGALAAAAPSFLWAHPWVHCRVDTRALCGLPGGITVGGMALLPLSLLPQLEA